MSSKSFFDGVTRSPTSSHSVNPQGLLTAAVGPVFLAAIPTLLSIIPGSDSISKDRVIPALSAFYIFWTFAATGAASVGGLGASRKEGLDNNHPRKDINNLTGLPLRLRSAHYNLMEMFPGFALAAALAQVSAPTNQNLINLLGLHGLLKSFVYYPAYLLDIAPVRSLAHLGATASVINVAWLLALGVK
ncbi:hypothetical protein BGZ57DRAFT_945492 [Hyaloscypha finlandica]|nr:hypothetical protein BGZ57DRAFT_945492 [Hyaloscypha finlandica]